MQSLRTTKWLHILLLASLTGVLLAGCGSAIQETSLPGNDDMPVSTEVPSMPGDTPPQETETTPGQGNPQSKVVRAATMRDQNPNIEPARLDELVAGNRAFAVDLFQALQEGSGENLFFSPYSISLALAMTYGGARGETAQEMAQTLNFSLPDEAVHSGFNALGLELASRNNEGDENMPGFKLNIANSAWVQYDRPFEETYLDLLAENYGAGLYLTDYASDPEGSRLAINEWVSDETEGKIKDLIPSGAIDALTRLVLANAIYFNAGWQHTFNEDLTEEAPFNLLDGSQKNVPMMSTSTPVGYGYTAGEGYQAVELPYNGGQLSMVILLPDAGSYEAFETGLDAETLATILEGLQIKQVELQMPKFSFESQFGLVGTLQQLGMQAAFDPQSADFSGIDGTRELSISDVVHKAFVDVDEKGTEAAAATAVIIGVTSMPMTDVQISIDRPFIFLIQDKPTGSILFLGRVLDPTG